MATNLLENNYNSHLFVTFVHIGSHCHLLPKFETKDSKLIRAVAMPRFSLLIVWSIECV